MYIYDRIIVFQYFVAVQYHPEYISRPMRPSPPYLGLILAATGKLQSFLAKVTVLAKYSGSRFICYFMLAVIGDVYNS
jgi:hypothetical protein